MKIKFEECSFCLVDVQERLMPHMDNKEVFLKNISTLIKGLKILEVPFVVNEQYKKGLGQTIQEIEALISEDKHFEKTTFSCCGNEQSFEAIKKLSKKTVIVAGIETHVCVLQTCLDLLEAGFNPILVADCVTSRKKLDTILAFKRLASAGVTITSYESLFFELLKDSKHKKFKDISKLIQ